MPVVESHFVRQPTFDRLDVTSISPREDRSKLAQLPRDLGIRAGRKPAFRPGKTDSNSPCSRGYIDERPQGFSRDWVNTLVDHLERHELTRHSLDSSTWSAMLELDRPVADKVVSIVASRNLHDVRNLNKWLLSLLRKEADLGEGHQPGDIEDLSRKVKDAAMEEIDHCRIRPQDLSARCIAVLNDLPVTSAVEVIHDFAQCDHEKINNPSGYLMGMLRKYTDNSLPNGSRTRSRGGPAAGGAMLHRGSGGGGAKGGSFRGDRGGERDPALPPVRHSAGTHRSSSSQLNAGFTPRGGAGGGLPPTPRAEEYSGERRSPERSRDRSDCDRDRTSDKERERSFSGRCRSRSDR